MSNTPVSENNVVGGGAEVRMTLEITRAATGKVETVEMVGYIDPEKLKELQNGSNTQHGSPQRSD
jgi:hypothetical protein